MKVKMKEMVKRMAITVLAAAVILGSAAPVQAEAKAKGTAFMKQKTRSVTPTIKSAKRANGKITVTVSVPTSKVKKLGKVKKITISYGSTKNSKKFEAYKATAKVTKKGKNQYTFTISNKKLASYKNAYMTVRFDGKSNWSKLVKVSGRAMVHRGTIYYLQCACGKKWSNTTGFTELTELWGEHVDEVDEKSDEEAGFVPAGSDEDSRVVSAEDILNIGAGNGNHGSYKTWSVASYSN